MRKFLFAIALLLYIPTYGYAQSACERPLSTTLQTLSDSAQATMEEDIYTAEFTGADYDKIVEIVSQMVDVPKDATKVTFVTTKSADGVFVLFSNDGCISIGFMGPKELVSEILKGALGRSL